MLSTTPNSAYLLHLAEHLIQSNPPMIQDALELVGMADVTKSTWELRLRIANILAAKEQIDDAQDVVSGINVSLYLSQFNNSGQIKLLLNVFITLHRIDEALTLCESGDIAGRITSIDDFDIRFRIANALINRGQTDRAKKLFFEIDVKKAYAENLELKDVYSRIGWALYWPKKDYTKLIEWFNKDLFISGNHEQTSDTYSYNSRLSPPWRLNYAQALAVTGDIDNAEKQVTMAYAENPALKDGYSRIAWSHFLEKKDYSSIRLWINRDEDSNRLSPAWRLNQAQTVAKIEGMEAALPLIEKVYDENPNLQNAYSRIAWACYIPEDMAYEKVIPYFEKDLQRNRLHGEWQLNYAQALMLVDKVSDAERVIKNTYIGNDKLKNGYARSGFYYYFVFNYNPIKTLEWFQRDLTINRISGMWSIHYAAILAILGNIETAMSIVEKAYKKEPNLDKGYSFIAWHGHMIKNNDPRKALLTYMLDKKHYSVGSPAVELLAGIHMHLGNTKKAEQLVKEYYKIDPVTNGCNILIGVCNYIRTNNKNYLYLQFKKDEEVNRINRPLFEYLYAAVLWKYNRINRSEFYLKKALKRTNLVKNHAFSWLKRLGCSNEHINQFINPQFDHFCGNLTQHSNSIRNHNEHKSFTY
jgi:hypothetical protein